MKRRRNQISGQFSARLIEMMLSSAYRALSLAGRRVLDRIEIEHARHGGNDNGKLPVTFEQFVEYGLHRHSIAPGIREVEAVGLAEVTQRGRAGNAEHRAPNLFRLTYRPVDGVPGDGTHEWRNIKTDQEAEQLTAAARLAKAEKKTKNQCRKMPAFGDKNRHRKSNFPVTKTVTKDTAKTITTSISRVGTTTHTAAREARPPQGAVASEPPVRMDLIHAFVANIYGWDFVESCTDEQLIDIASSDNHANFTPDVGFGVPIKMAQARGAK